MARHASRRTRRLPVLVAVAAVLVAGAVADRAGTATTSPANATSPPAPLAAPADALSSSWFCAGDGAEAPGHLAIFDAGATAETARVRLLSDNGVAAPVQLVPVQPGTSAVVPESLPPGGRFGAAVVEVDGASAVEQIVDSPLGRAVSECANSGSSHWYLPSGQTRVNASETILLLNPYPGDSIADLSFVTDQGPEAPLDFQSIPVPHDSLVAVDLGTHLRRRAYIATTVSTRSGAVVAWSEEQITPPAAGEPIAGTPAANAPLADPAAPTPGLALSLGAPGPATSWAWPDGLAGNGVDEQYLIFNPGTTTADVQLAIGLTQGSAEPFRISVGPGQIVPVVSEQQARIPAGTAHTALLTSINGVPVVAARSAAAASSPLAGIGVMMGEPFPARAWVVPWSASSGGRAGDLIVYNPGGDPAQVTVSVAGATTTQSITPGGRLAIPVPSDQVGPVTLTATRPVYVEYDLIRGGYSLGPAIPLSG